MLPYTASLPSGGALGPALTAAVPLDPWTQIPSATCICTPALQARVRHGSGPALSHPQVAAGQPKSYSTGQEAIEPEARQLLLDLYRPSNTLLAQLTGDSRFEDWNKGEVAAVEAAGAGTAGGGAAGAAPQQAAVGGGGAPQAAGR